MSVRSSVGCVVRTGCCVKNVRSWQSGGLVRDGDRHGAVTAFQFVSANQAIYAVATIALPVLLKLFMSDNLLIQRKICYR
jgi:hypothetical protein